jgi:4-amino-4-deoxy-L-arabinose transferase-like glycosyltransferase
MQHAISPLASTNGLRLFWLLSLLVAFFYNIGAFPLFDLDEGAFSQTTREMFLRNDFLTTYLNGEPRYDKPILIYWLQALSIKVFGTSEFSFRLPSAIAASLWSLFIVAFTWSISTARKAFIAGILMTGAMGVGLIGKAATADALLNCSLAGAMLTLYLYFTRNELRYLLATAFFTAIGFTTKGPIAVIIPTLVSLIYSLWDRHLEQWLRMITNPSAWLLFLLIATPWYIVHYLREGTAFLENFIGTHNIGRFSSAMEGHGGAWWYYLPAILLIAFPFGFQILQPLFRLRTTINSHIGRYLLSWFFVVFIFFSFSATKLPHYMLYGITPLIILTALYMPEKPNLKIVFYPLFLLIIVLISLPLLVDYLLPGIHDAHLSTALSNTIDNLNLSYILTLSVILGLSGLLFSNNYWPHQGRLLSAGLVSTFIISEFLLPLVAQIQQEPIKQAGLIAAGYDKPAVMWRLNRPSFSIYSNKVTPRRKPLAGELVLTKSRHLNELSAHEVLFEKNGIALASVTPKEISDVFGITTRVEPTLLMVNSNISTDIGVTDSPASVESINVSSDQYTDDTAPRSGPVGSGDNFRGRTSSNRSPTATSQKTSKVDHHSLNLGSVGGAVGTTAENRFFSAKATRSHRRTIDYRYWSHIQKWKFSIRPHLYPVRVARMHGFMDQRRSIAQPVSVLSTTHYTGSAIAQCCRHPLADRHHGRYGHRLAISDFRQSVRTNRVRKRHNESLGWPVVAHLHPLPSTRIRFRLYQCQGFPTRNSAHCTRSSVYGRFENNRPQIVDSNHDSRGL